MKNIGRAREGFPHWACLHLALPALFRALCIFDVPVTQASEVTTCVVVTGFSGVERLVLHVLGELTRHPHFEFDKFNRVEHRGRIEMLGGRTGLDVGVKLLLGLGRNPCPFNWN